MMNHFTGKIHNSRLDLFTPGSFWSTSVAISQSKKVVLVSQRAFKLSATLCFSFPFPMGNTVQQTPFKGADVSQANRNVEQFPGPGQGLAPSPFQKKNTLSASPISRKQLVVNRPMESTDAMFQENIPIEEFKMNESDFGEELLAEAYLKHKERYIQVVVTKIPSTKAFFDNLKQQDNEYEEKSLLGSIQDLVSKFSIPPLGHPHSPDFEGAGSTSSSSYFKKPTQYSESEAMATYFNNTSKSFVPTGKSKSESAQPEQASSLFSPFEKPNFSPPSKASKKRVVQTKTDDSKSPFQVPNTSVPEYYSQYMVSSSQQNASNDSSQEDRSTSSKQDPFQQNQKGTENEPVLQLKPMPDHDMMQKPSFSVKAPFPGSKQTTGASVRNLAATSLASNYSGNVESVSESGDQPSSNHDSVFVSNANVNFNPYTSGTVVKCPERISDIDEQVLSDPNYGKDFFSHRSLRPLDGESIDRKKLRLLGDSSEQDKVKKLVVTEEDAHAISMRVKFGGVSDRPLCKMCGKVFHDCTSLMSHIRTKHRSEKIDVFSKLNANLGSLRQVEEANPAIYQNTDIADWYDFNHEEKDAFYHMTPSNEVKKPSPEILAGYVARKQAQLSEENASSACDITKASKSSEVAVSSSLVNHITLSGELEYVGERTYSGQRYLQMYITIQPSDEARELVKSNAESERIPVRYMLRVVKQSKPNRRDALKSPKREPLEKSSKKELSADGFAPEDLMFVSSIKTALQNSSQCIAVGELKQASLINTDNAVINYAYVRMSSLKGSLVFF